MRLFLLAMAAALPWSGAALAENLPTSSSVPAAVTPPALPSAAPAVEDQPMISQGNPAWSWIPLGRSTIGKIGCLSMSLYDAFVQMGLLAAGSTDPGAFVRMLSAYGLFTSNGDLRWDLDRLFPVWIERTRAFGSAALNKAAAALSNGKKVLLQVRTARGTFHWVGVSRIVNGDAEIRDPNGGRTEWLGDTYRIDSIRGMVTIAAQ